MPRFDVIDESNMGRGATVKLRMFLDKNGVPTITAEAPECPTCFIAEFQEDGTLKLYKNIYPGFGFQLDEQGCIKTIQEEKK